MRSIILASIVALAFAATPAFEHVFEPKSEYHYQFDGLVLSGLPTAQQTEMSQSRISARARLQSIDDRHIHLQLIKIEMAASNMPESDEQYPELRSLEQRDISKEYKNLLELPVRAQIKNGLVSNIQFDAKDAEWSKNVKRSVLNMISFVEQQPTQELESRMENDEELQTFFTNEKTIEGDCQVAYTITRENKKTIITKTVNFNKCESRPQAIYGNQYTEELTQQEQEKVESFKPQTVYTYTLEGELLKEVEVRSIYSHNLNGQEVMKTETRSKLTHEETHDIKKEIKKVTGEPEEIIYSTEWERSVEDFFKNGDKAEVNPFKEFPTERKMDMLKSILEKVQDDETNEPETVHQLARLVRLLRTTTSAELKKVHSEHYNKKEQKVQRLIDQALAIAGTKNTIQHLLSHLEADTIADQLKAALLLKSVQETPYPSEAIAKMLIDFSEKQKSSEIMKQSAILAHSVVVRGIVSQKVQKNQLVREDSREFKQETLKYFLDMFRESETTAEKVLWLKALGNAGLDISVNEINSIINDRRQPLVVRREAVDCLRLLDNVMPLKLQRVLLPIYKNQRNPQEVRMAALWSMIQTRPSQSVLVQVVSQMEKESNQQVQQFTLQLLQQFAKSTNPQYKQLASDCAAVLSFTRFESQQVSPINTKVAQLPMFARDVLSGAQLDFAAIFSKNSLLPTELHASLESLFGGNWNKQLIQFGFTQQNIEKAVSKIAKEMNTELHGRQETRGDRTSEEKITLLQKLAKQLKIKARQQDDEDQEGFVMTYLRYKNIDYLIVPFTQNEIEKLLRTSMDMKYESSKVFDGDFSGRFTHAAYFYETVRRVPTTLGLPLILSGKVPTVATFEGKLSLDNRKDELNLEVRPSIASTHIYEMRMMTPLFEQGIKTIQSINSWTPFNLQLEANEEPRKIELKTKVNIPQDETVRVQVSTRPVVYLRYPGYSKNQYVETEEKTLVIPQLNQKTQDMEKTHKMFGLEITTGGNVLRQWTLENVLFADQDYRVVIKNHNKKPAVFESTFVIEDNNRDSDFDIKIEQALEPEFETEGESKEAHREAFNELAKDLNKSPYASKKMIITFRAPEKHLLKVETALTYDYLFRALKTEMDVLISAEQDWTLQNTFVAIAPETVASLKQLREQPHREVMINMLTRWGLSKNNKKNEIVMKAQLGQSKEQRKYQRALERQTEVPEYDLIVKSARLNQLDVVAQYKLDEQTQKQLRPLIARLNWYLNRQFTVSTQEQENKENRMHMRLTIDPITREYVNMTVQTPEQQLQLRNVQVPRVPLPSIAQWQLSSNQHNGQVCSVSPKSVQTFDDMIYSAPLTTCWSAIAKDCSEQPKFAVLAKKESKNSKNLIVRFVTEEHTFEFSKINGEYIAKINGADLKGLHRNYYGISTNEGFLFMNGNKQVTIQYDGQNVQTKLNHIRATAVVSLCGLCGNNDNEMDNELRTAEDEETEDIEKFHRSFLLNDDECEIEEDVVSDKKNYRKMERNLRSSYELENEDDEEYETEDKKNVENNLIKKTEVKEFSHRICFSLEGVPACRRNYDEQETVQQKVKFTCLPRHDAEARRLLKQTRQQDVLQLKSYPVSFVQPITVPTQCEYAY